MNSSAWSKGICSIGFDSSAAFYWSRINWSEVCVWERWATFGFFEPYLLTDVDCQSKLGLAFQAENFPYPLRFCLNRNWISSGHFHVLLFIYECACILQLGWEWSTFFFKMCMCQCLTVYTIYIPPWAHWIQPLGEIYFWERYTTSNYIEADCALFHLLVHLLTIIKKGTPVLLWSTRIENFCHG